MNENNPPIPENASSFEEGQEMMHVSWDRDESGATQVGKTEKGKWINGAFVEDSVENLS